jgi:glycosyltransferase involved in cell wall biosynthesis
LSKKQLKVLHIAPTPFFSDRGCHMRIKGIVSALDHLNIRSIVCTYHHGRDIDGIETVRTPTLSGYRKHEAGPSAFKYIADLLLLWQTCRVIRRERPDIIYGHLHEGALIGWVARACCLRRTVPLVCDIQGSLVGELESHGYFRHLPFSRPLFLLIEKIVIRLPQALTCSSPVSFDFLVNQFGLDPAKVVLVNDSADLCPIDPVASDDLRRSLSLPLDRPLVIYAGALQRAKGLDVLCETMLSSKKRNLWCHFLLLGYPEEEIRAYVQEHGLQDICTVVGRVPFERLGHYLGLASLALEPKYHASGEGSGKLFNYMGAGLPVVCFDTENNRRILGPDGYFARTGCADDFLMQIEAALAAPEEATRRGKAGQCWLLKNFSVAVTAEKIIGVFSTVPPGSRPLETQSL